MKHTKLFEEFINEFGGDFTKEYDGFIVLDVKNQKAWKFRYIKGTKGVKAEDAAIAQVMKETGQPRGVFMVHGSIKKGEFDKTDEISGIKLGVLESVLDEAMVQVAGKNKPSGAQVLAILIVKYLDDNQIMPSNANKKKITEEIKQLIMDSTF